MASRLNFSALSLWSSMRLLSPMLTDCCIPKALISEGDGPAAEPPWRGLGPTVGLKVNLRAGELFLPHPHPIITP